MQILATGLTLPVSIQHQQGLKKAQFFTWLPPPLHQMNQEFFLVKKKKNPKNFQTFG